MKEWKCLEVGHQRRIAHLIEDNQKDGWSLHTYQAAGCGTIVKHYLLFMRETE